MTKIYIAGPMSGMADFNFPAFFEAERQLESLGYEVINPAHNDGATVQEALESAGTPDSPNKLWSYYMKRDLPHVMDVDMLCVLPGWQKSKGATLEVTVARALGLPLMVLKNGNLVPRVEVIGISGWARAGKDTVAAHLVEKYGYTRMSFADPMREALRRLDPLITVGEMRGVSLASAINGLGWESLKSVSPDVRGLMQRMGTEVGRDMFGQNFWVDAAIDSIEDGSKVVFADVRFANEAEAIKNLGGEVWRISRNGVGPANDHISETALNDYIFDVYIKNDGTIEDTNKCVDDLLDK
jgi:hypothetical protein